MAEPKSSSSRREVHLPRGGRWTGRSPGRMRGKALSWERVAGRSPDGCGAVPGLAWYRPPTFRNRALGSNRSGDVPSGRLVAAPTARSVHPGPPGNVGCFPSSVRAYGPATFPVGEGDLPAGGCLAPANSDLSCFFPQKTLYWTQLQRKGRKDHEHGFQTQADHPL